MPDNSLLMLLDKVRRKTLRVLHGVTEQQAHWVPSGLKNTILWHSGHCFVVVESLIMRALGEQPRFPDNWFEMFKWKGDPAEIPADRWPSLGEVVAELKAQRRRLRPLIAQLSEEQLSGVVPERPERTVRFYILHALRDEACHTGEIWLLRKIQEVG